MIHLYCVVDEPEAALRACEDGAGPRFRLVRTPRLSCIARDCATSDPPADENALVDHDLFVRRMMAVSTVVPFRYGTVLPSVADAERELMQRTPILEQLLQRVAGRVEFALRAGAEATPARSFDGTGRSYLRMLGQESASPALQELHRTLTARADRSVSAWDRRSGFKASYLVSTGGVDAFRQVLLEAVARGSDLTDVSLTGPWAPYSFVSEECAGQLVPAAGAGRCNG